MTDTNCPNVREARRTRHGGSRVKNSVTTRANTKLTKAGTLHECRNRRRQRQTEKPNEVEVKVKTEASRSSRSSGSLAKRRGRRARSRHESSGVTVEYAIYVKDTGERRSRSKNSPTRTARRAKGPEHPTWLTGEEQLEYTCSRELDESRDIHERRDCRRQPQNRKIANEVEVKD